MDLEDRNLRSIRNNEEAYVRFINLTKRTVQVIWINFTGGCVSYQILARGRYVDVNTYKNHPWIVLDPVTGDRLHIEKSFVYFPKTAMEYLREEYPNRRRPEGLQARIPARITLPLHGLRLTTLLAIRNLLRVPEDVEGLELPKELSSDLKKVIKQRNDKVTQPWLMLGNQVV